MTLHHILALLAAFSRLAFSGCETTEGVGEDLEEAGESIDEAEEDAQE